LEDVQAYKQSEKRAQEMQRATLIQAFFNRTSSQLTEHGLLALHQVTPPSLPLSPHQVRPSFLDREDLQCQHIGWCAAMWLPAGSSDMMYAV